MMSHVVGHRRLFFNFAVDSFQNHDARQLATSRMLRSLAGRHQSCQPAAGATQAVTPAADLPSSCHFASEKAKLVETTPSGFHGFFARRSLCAALAAGSDVVGACHHKKVYGTHLLHHSPACSRGFSHSLHSARGSLHRCAVQSPLAVAGFASLVAVALVVAHIVRARHPPCPHLHLSPVLRQPAPQGAQINLYATRNSTRLHRADTCAARLALTRPWSSTGSLAPIVGTVPPAHDD